MSEEDGVRSMGQVIQIDEARIQDHLGEMVRGTVEETLNAMLDAEADRLCGAGRYERSHRPSVSIGSWRSLPHSFDPATARSPRRRGQNKVLPENLKTDLRPGQSGHAPQILRDIGNNKGPKKSIIAFGYAGWAAGQLEDEHRRGIWFTTSADPKLIFDEDRERVWESAYSRRTQDL